MWDQFSNSQICLRFRLSIVLEMFSSNYLPTVCCLVIHLILENCWFIEFLRLTRYYSHIHLRMFYAPDWILVHLWSVKSQTNTYYRYRQVVLRWWHVDFISILFIFDTVRIFWRNINVIDIYNKEWNSRHWVKDFWVFENWKRSSVLDFFF